MLGTLEPLSAANHAALTAWNLLSNGMGGIDWAGLDVVVELLAVEDVEALVEALLCIRMRPSRSADKQEE